MRRSLLVLAGAALAGALGAAADAQPLLRGPSPGPGVQEPLRAPGPAAPRTGGGAGDRPAETAPGPGAPASVAPFRMDTRPGASAPSARTDGAPAAASSAPLRPVLPLGPMRLAGETDSRSWTIDLTAAEAQSATALQVGYTNAVVVMPEVSRLRVVVNGEAVLATPISSAAGVSRVTAPLRPGLLKAGENAVRVEVLQRHRVECSVTGTYELWTDLDPTATGIAFPPSGRPPLGGLEDLSAVGPDAAGVTTIHVVAPRAARPEVRERLFRAVQTIALRGRFAHPVVRISESDPGPSPPGTLKVVLAVAGELPLAMSAPPGDAASRPLAGFVGDDRRSAALVISGPAWTDVDRAIALLATYRTRTAEEEGSRVQTSSWSAPDAPLVLHGRTLRFSELGIPTTEFSGRRLTTRFRVALPGDFYAGDYGEARLFLDAAIAPTVRPGSRIDIYVNDRISATAPIGIGQNVFEQHPIRVAMKYFRPGINTVVVEAILATAADETCAPGSTLPGANRLALFDSTTFEVPGFARIGRRPDLAEVTTAGLVADDEPLAVALPRFDLPAYAAAATLVARMAADTGRVRSVRAGTVAEAPPGSVIFVGPAGQLPPEVLEQVGLPPDLGRTWTVPAAGPGEAPAAPAVSGPPRTPQELQDRATTGSSQDVRERWDETLRGESRLARAFDSVQRWFRERFDGVPAAVRPDAAVEASSPLAGASWLIAEGVNPARDGSWLVVTAPTEQALREGTTRITRPTLWSRVSGRLTALQFEPERLTAQAADTFEFVTTQPLTPRNLRLIAANWLSTNVLPYALLIILGCTGLGLATHYLVGQLGRRS